MKKKIIISIIMFICVVLAGLTIYNFSSMDAKESNSGSEGTIATTIKNILNITNEYQITNSHPDQEKLDHATQLLNKPMRKVMHFSVYFILAVVLMIFINYLFNNKRYIISFMITLLLCVGFAYSDEYHQTLVEGRTGQYQDVVIDSSGATFGCLVYGTYYLAYFMGRRREQKDIIEKALKKVQRDDKVNKSVK